MHALHLTLLLSESSIRGAVQSKDVEASKIKKEKQLCEVEVGKNVPVCRCLQIILEQIRVTVKVEQFGDKFERTESGDGWTKDVGAGV